MHAIRRSIRSTYNTLINYLLLDLTHADQLFRFIPLIKELVVFKAVRRLIGSARDQQLTWSRQPRKIVIISYTPMIVAIVQCYLLWLIKDDSFPQLKSDDDVVIVAS